jgi:protocatechuate 3,4-dioxygenase beta subunit
MRFKSSSSVRWLAICLIASVALLTTVSTFAQTDATITVTVIDGMSDPIANADVSINPESGCCGVHAQTDATGIAILSVPPGNWIISAQAEGYGRSYFHSTNSMQQFRESAEVLTFNAGDTESYTLNLLEGGTISGRVTDDQGDPIENMGVDLHQGDFGACTNANGEYTISGLVSGTSYSVYTGGNTFCENGPQNYIMEYWDNQPDEYSADPIYVPTSGEGSTDVTGINFVLDEGGTITGTTRDADTNNPIGPMWIDVEYDMGDHTEHTWGGCTEPNGTYSVSGLRPGSNIIVSARTDGSCGGPQNYIQTYYNGKDQWDQADRITVQSGQTTSGIDLYMQPGAIITGQVTSDGSTGIPNANVWVDPPQGCCGNGTGTDDQGFYNLVVPAGGWILQSDAQGYGRVYYNSQTGMEQFWENAEPLNLNVGDTETINLMLPEAGTISGRVTDDQGDPIENMGVDLAQGGYGSCTDDNGNYTISGLWTGQDYKIRTGGNTFCENGPNTFLEEYWDNQPDEQSANPIYVPSGQGKDVTGKDFSLASANVISGVVEDAHGNPIPNANVNVNPAQGCCGTGTQTDQNGYYEVGVTDGSWMIMAEADGYGRVFWSSQGGQQFSQDAEIVNLASQNHVADFVLPEGRIITGRVTDEQGNPIENMGVDIEQGYYGTCTDDQGDYTMTGLWSGESYKIRTGGNNFCWNGPQDYVQEYWDNAFDTNSATPILIPSGGNPNEIPDINFQLGTGASISGTVRDADTGDPIANIQVHANYRDTGDHFDTCTDENGNYTLSGFQTGRPISVNAVGGQNWCQGGPQNYVQQYYDHQAGYHVADLITINEGDPDPTSIDFDLIAGAVISGTLYDSSNNNPLGNGSITAEDPNTHNWVAGWGTNPDGTYHLVVPAGSYKLHASAQGYVRQYYNSKGTDWDNADVVTVNVGDVFNIDWYLDPGAIISGFVKVQGTNDPIMNMVVGINGDNYGEGTCTDQNGYYKLTAPVNSPVTVNAGEGYNWCGGPTNYITEYWQEATSQDQATPITATQAGPYGTSIDFDLDAAGTVSGNVTDGATGLHRVPIRASFSIGQDQHNMYACTEENGDYLLAGLPLDTDITVIAGGDNFCGDTQYFEETYDPVFQLSGGTPEKTGVDFTMTMASAPAAPTLTSPQGDIDEERPAYQWQAVDYASEYRLWISERVSPETALFDQTYPAGTVCTGNTCEVTPAYNLTLGENYTWWIEAINTSGRVWSAGMDFTYTWPAANAPTLIAPADGSTDLDGTLTFEWSEVDYVTRYSITLMDQEGGATEQLDYELSDLTCNAGTCSKSIDIDFGHYEWKVRGWNSVAQYGLYSDTWSFFSGPEPPVIVAPTSTVETLTTTFTWEPSDGATHYELFVSQGRSIAFNDWLTPTCGTICDHTLELPNGDYEWWVRAGTASAGGAWAPSYTTGQTFTVAIPIPTTPALISPINSETVTGTPPTVIFQWNHDPDTITTYQFYLGIPNGQIIWKPGLSADAICNETTCEYPLNLTLNGDYEWWIRAVNDTGYAPTWMPDDDDNGEPFTVNWPTPSNIVMVSPTANAEVPNGQVAFTWETDGPSTWYELIVKDDQDNEIISQWYIENGSDIGGYKGITCSTTCTTEAYNLPFDLYTWKVRGWNDAAYGDFSTPVAFYSGPQPPTEMPVLSAPANDATIQSFETTFTWSTVDRATDYYLWVQGDNKGVVVNQIFNAATVCSGGTCSYSQNLANDTYEWWVQARNAGGNGPWSPASDYDGHPFTVAVPTPGMVTMIHPAQSSSVTTAEVTFTWEPTDFAQQYELYVAGPGYVFDEILTPGFDLTCDATTCTHTLTLTKNGTYQWWVLAKNSVGDGDWSPSPTTGIIFTMNQPGPGVINQIGPINGYESPINSIPFQWTEDGPSTWYLLQVRDEGNMLVVNTWYDENDQDDRFGGEAVTCTSGTCAVSHSLPNGWYTWTVIGWNDPAGNGPGNAPASFHSGYVTPGSVGLIAPVGIVNTNDLTFQWEFDPFATHYELWIDYPDGGHSDQMLIPGTGGLSCDASTCTFTGLKLQNGTYEWWVQTWNTGVAGPWSPTPTTGVSFTINAPALGIITGIAPAEGGTAALTHTLSWVPDPYANTYHYRVNNANDDVIAQSILEPGDGGLVCTQSECTLTITVPSAGAYEWWVQGINAAGEPGSWSPPGGDGWDYTVTTE